MTGTPDVAELGKAGALPADPASETRRVLPPALADGEQPSHVTAERAILSSLLWAATYEPGAAQASSIAHLLEPKMFDRAEHGHAFAAMLAIEASGGQPEPVAVGSEAARQGHRIDVEYFEDLVHRATQPTDTKLRQWATQIRDAWSRRAIVVYAKEVISSAGDMRLSATDVRDQAMEKLHRLSDGVAVGGAVVTATEAAHQLYRELGDTSPVPVLTTGFRDFDAMQGGLFLEDVSLIAARTSVGKSILAMAFAKHIAKTSGYAVAYASLEMPARMFVMRSVSADAGVDFKKLRMKKCAPAELQMVATAMNVLPPELHFVDNIVQSCGSISAEVLRLQSALAKRGKRVGLLVIDHVHLIKPEKENSRLQRIDHMIAVTRWMISVSRALKCHVLGCAQISREAERQGKDTRPMLHHIQDAGAFEQNVNNVYIVHRKKLKSGGFSTVEDPQLIVAKARNDATGTIKLGFDGRYMRFKDWEPPLADLPSRQYVHGALPGGGDE
jgi:replicative DNA helicase